MSKVTIQIPLTRRQRQMIESPARSLFIGCGTKTGKTTGLASWVLEGLLRGEACAWIAPWFQRSRAAFEVIKNLASPLIDNGSLKATEGVLRLKQASGTGVVDFYSADNFSSLFGGNYSRVICDEASRMPEGIFAAVMTVISATRGKARFAFNLELGSRNWAIRNLLRVQKMSPKERIAAGEDFLTFPSGGDGLVDSSLIELMRDAMPEPLWRALYLAEIPESDLSLFRNLDRIFTGEELSEPKAGKHYLAGIDLGRKRDWSVVTVIDESGDVVATDRFHEISWSLQCERAAALCKTFRCEKVYVDQTGIGDAIVERLEALGLEVSGFIFTAPAKKELIEKLILCCDRIQITLPATEKFQTYKTELSTFEYMLDGGSIKYAAPPGCHDDCVMSLALAVHGFKAADFGELPVIVWMKRAGAKLGLWHGEVQTFESEKKTAGWNKQPVVGNPSGQETLPSAPPFGHLDPCAFCGSPLVVNLSGKIHCNQCGRDWWPSGEPLIPHVRRDAYMAGRYRQGRRF